MTESLDDTKNSLSIKNAGNPNFIEHEPTEALIKQVKAMASCGVQGKLIAASIGISEPTLIKHYKDHMNVARASAHLQVGNSLFQRAINGDTSSAIFYAKTQMGWREPKYDNNENDENFNYKEAIADDN
jgi:hypothetical protein